MYPLIACKFQVKKGQSNHNSPKNTCGKSKMADNLHLTRKTNLVGFFGHVSVTKCTSLYQVIISLFILGLIVFTMCGSIHTCTVT